MVIKHPVSANACNVLRQVSVDDFRRVWRSGRAAGDPRVTPSGSAVPEIFHSGVVVESNSVREVLLEEFSGVGVPYVGVIPTEMVILRMVGHLHKAADM